MSIKSLRLADIANLPEQEQEQRIKALSDRRLEPLNGDSEDLTRQISTFETRYEMSSDTMLNLCREGKIRETADVGTWMMLLVLRDRLGKPAH
ncbi:MAG TPA: hypothetical protein VMV69_18725 [Pirellulales bacterium]|nr:hypothetical protein [Pirellulales bacterium]